MADQSALRVLKGKTRKLADQSIGPSETVHVCLVGNSGQAMLALDDRLLVIKTGVMSGNAFGGKATSFPFNQITGLEVQLGLTAGVLAVQTAAFQGGQVGSFWSNDKNHDPFKLPNCIPINKSTATKWQPHLDRIRSRIAIGHWGGSASSPVATSAPSPTPPAASSLAAQLAQLGDLHSQGVLTANEFEQAKRRLLAGS